VYGAPSISSVRGLSPVDLDIVRALEAVATLSRSAYPRRRGRRPVRKSRLPKASKRI